MSINSDRFSTKKTKLAKILQDPYNIRQEDFSQLFNLYTLKLDNQKDKQPSLNKEISKYTVDSISKKISKQKNIPGMNAQSPQNRGITNNIFQVSPVNKNSSNNDKKLSSISPVMKSKPKMTLKCQLTNVNHELKSLQKRNKECFIHKKIIQLHNSSTEVTNWNEHTSNNSFYNSVPSNLTKVATINQRKNNDNCFKSFSGIAQNEIKFFDNFINDFEFLHILGAGMISIVKLADWISKSYLSVAIKIYDKNLVKISQQYENIKNEEKCYQKLFHPFIIKMYFQKGMENMKIHQTFTMFLNMLLEENCLM